jgi:hypothetical protein
MMVVVASYKEAITIMCPKLQHNLILDCVGSAFSEDFVLFVFAFSGDKGIQRFCAMTAAWVP